MSLLSRKKLTRITKCQYWLFYFLFFVFIYISPVNAADNVKSIELSSLGHFEAKFSEIKQVELLKGQRLIGDVSHLSGANYSVTFPFDIQQISYLVKNGSEVEKGDIIALVEGYDVHHFIDEYELAKVLLEIQKEHFQINKQYSKSKTINSSQWIDITKSYYEAKLNFEHIQHLMSFVRIDENESISLISPKAGIIKIPNLVDNRAFGDLAFDVIDKATINVKVVVPLLMVANLSHFEVNPSCHLKISSVEKLADKFHQIVWAQPSSINCKLVLGQTLKVNPVYTITGYKITKTAIFEFENNNFIAIKDKETLSLIAINIIGTNAREYIFTTQENIGGKQGLISSVSILQGNLLSLGAE
jgi:hypothetical protein